MTGLTNYTANNILNYITGQIAEPALPSVWLALFTAVGTDAGSGFTEVSTNGYTRVQVAGTLTASSGTTTSSPTLTFSSVPSWIVAGMLVYDTTTSQTVGTVLSVSSPTVTLTSNAAHAVTTSDVLSFSMFGAPSGTAPSTITNGGIVTMPTATSTGWGTVIAFGLYDASTVGNLLTWDFLDNFTWLPFESTSVNTGNGPVFTAKGNGYSNLDPLVATVEYGGTFPTLTTGTLTSYTMFFAANVATDSFTATVTSGGSAFAATSTGSGMVRKIVQQSIPGGVTASFAASALTITAA